MLNMYGPGDPETWGAPAGHINDPRTEMDEDSDPVLSSDVASDLAGRADRAWLAGNRKAAADLYREAADALMYAAEMAESQA